MHNLYYNSLMIGLFSNAPNEFKNELHDFISTLSLKISLAYAWQFKFLGLELNSSYA